MNTPPHEAALVGLAMHDGNVIDDAHVTEADFASPQAGGVWHLMTSLHREGQATDPATVVANLHRGDVRGVDPVILAEWYGSAPVQALADHYARLVADSGTRQRLALVKAQIDDVLRADVTATEAVEIIRAHVDATSRSVAGLGLLGDEIDATVEGLQAPTTIIPTPWADLNHLIGGWAPGRLYVVGARPGSGKSLFGMQAAMGLAGYGAVAISTIEMTKVEMHERMLAAAADVDLSDITDHALTADDYARVRHAAQKLKPLTISLDERTHVSPTDIRSHARTLGRRQRLSGLVVDYLQLMSAARGDRRPRHEVVAEMSRQLKNLAKDLDVPVIALSQLNRASEGRADKTPTMADLRESGALEQDANVVILLHVSEDDPASVNVIVPKNRHGKKGSLRLVMRGHVARLDNYAWSATSAVAS
jgi:replicative DNA helicase